MLVDHEVMVKATCVDFEPAVRRARATTSDKIEWIAQDLFELNLAEGARYDVVYIGNVFHHYSLADNVRYVKRIANSLSPGAVIIVQDYLVASDPRNSPLYAAILGVHFALTSTGGRCYSKDEISRVISEALPKAALQSENHLDSSDLLLYRCA
jgi:2-polyprenyl-3-methyl-5-hydroxy-6-metoxy-1,4-benzoquinol methylase